MSLNLENFLKNTKKSFSRKQINNSLRKNLLYGLSIPLLFFASCEEDEPYTFPDKEYQEEQNNDFNQNDNNSLDESKTCVFKKEDAEKISSYSYETGKINFSEPQEMNKGDIIVSGISDETPYGALREVESVSGDKKSFETSQASLTEVNKDISFDKTFMLSPDDTYKNLKSSGEEKLEQGKERMFKQEFNVLLYDEDQDLGTRDDQVKIEGKILFQAVPTTGLKISNGEVDYFKYEVDLWSRAYLEMNSSADFYNFSKEATIYHTYLTPFVIPSVIILPIVITPTVTLDVGVEGNLKNEAYAKITNDVSSTIKIHYDGTWSSERHYNKDFSFSSYDANSEIDLKGYVGVEIGAMVYGVAGPYAEGNPYARINVEKIYNDLELKLYAGIDINAGLKVADIFGYNLPEYNKNILNLEKELSSKIIEQKEPVQEPEEPNENTAEGKIVYSVRNESKDRYNLAIMDSDGSNVKIFNSGIWDISPSWFPNGNEILYTSYNFRDGDYYYDIYKINSDESGKEPLIESNYETEYPTISPEGNKIAYIQNNHIYVANYNGNYPNKITSTERDYKDLSWSHYNGGDNLWFSAMPKKEGESPDPSELPEPSDEDIYKINIGSKKVTKVIDIEYFPASQPEVYKNNLIFSSIAGGDPIYGGGSGEIYKSDIYGNNLEQITDLQGTQSWPTWNHNGTEIYFISKGDVWKKNLENSSLTQLTNTPNKRDTSPDYIKK